MTGIVRMPTVFSAYFEKPGYPSPWDREGSRSPLWRQRVDGGPVNSRVIRQPRAVGQPSTWNAPSDVAQERCVSYALSGEDPGTARAQYDPPAATYW